MEEIYDLMFQTLFEQTIGKSKMTILYKKYDDPNIKKKIYYES